MKVVGLEKMVAALRDRATKRSRELKAIVTVGYGASYSVSVHENLDIFHKIGEAKFLESAIRELKPLLASILREALKQGVTVPEALLATGKVLQKESQARCPVRTGALKASAYTHINYA